jgi:8-oxo-dGTP pyrophosphatase MutT (NUDIX family)
MMQRSFQIFPEHMPADLLMFADNLRVYLSDHPEDEEIHDWFQRFLLSGPRVFERANASGHFTGSAWLVSADGSKVLLMHHRKLGRWLQPGGHADGDKDLARVALREAQEETGVAGLSVDEAIFDIDRHRIPARAHEPEHWHYDVRHVVRAGVDETFVVNAESHALAWRPVVEMAGDETLDASLRRMARKWLARA